MRIHPTSAYTCHSDTDTAEYPHDSFTRDLKCKGLSKSARGDQHHGQRQNSDKDLFFISFFLLFIDFRYIQCAFSCDKMLWALCGNVHRFSDEVLAGMFCKNFCFELNLSGLARIMTPKLASVSSPPFLYDHNIFTSRIYHKKGSDLGLIT